MKVKKILNNNVIVTLNEQKREIIVIGKGLAFGLRVGDLIDDSRIDKIFSLNNQSEVSRFQQLLTQVPEKYVEMTESFIDYAKEQLGKKLSNIIYITLTDHIYTMVERAKSNAYVKNTMLWDIKRLYRDEFFVAQEIVQKINQCIGSNYDENESASIAMHFVNAQTGLDFLSTSNITKVISEILNVVKYNFRINYDEDSLSYYRFVVHLRSFAQRIFSNTTYNDDIDIELQQHIQRKYESAHHCSQLVAKYIYETYNYTLQSEESMYLTIHIQKVVKDSQKL